MVLTNLFRDQLDRYGEIDITMKLLDRAMKMAPKMKVIVNGDDALSAYLAMESGNVYVTYGIPGQVFDQKETGEIREGRFCQIGAENGFPMTFTITASWAATTARSAALQGRRRFCGGSDRYDARTEI